MNGAKSLNTLPIKNLNDTFLTKDPKMHKNIKQNVKEGCF